MITSILHLYYINILYSSIFPKLLSARGRCEPRFPASDTWTLHSLTAMCVRLFLFILVSPTCFLLMSARLSDFLKLTSVHLSRLTGESRIFKVGSIELCIWIPLTVLCVIRARLLLRNNTRCLFFKILAIILKSP